MGSDLTLDSSATGHAHDEDAISNRRGFCFDCQQISRSNCQRRRGHSFGRQQAVPTSIKAWTAIRCVHPIRELCDDGLQMHTALGGFRQGKTVRHVANEKGFHEETRGRRVFRRGCVSAALSYDDWMYQRRAVALLDKQVARRYRLSRASRALRTLSHKSYLWSFVVRSLNYRNRRILMPRPQDMHVATLAEFSDMKTSAQEEQAHEQWMRARPKRRKTEGPRMPCPCCAV